MPKIVRLNKRNWPKLLRRSELDTKSVMPRVRQILNRVKKEGDRALFQLELELDGSRLRSLEVSDEEIVDAYEEIGERKVRIIREAARIIERFHRKQLPKERRYKVSKGATVGVMIRPIPRVGIYVPGGRSGYPSTVLMTCIPARVAGVDEIYIATPPKNGRISPHVLVAADVVGVDGIFKLGGAQAIAAFAFGTRTVPKVDKIVGPGNVWVQAAKALLSTEVQVDFQAGPSEVMILADNSAKPEWVALEMLAQAEHDPCSASILLTPSPKLARSVKELVEQWMDNEVLVSSFSKYSRIVLTKSLEQAIGFANAYAPEHLVLMVRNPERWRTKIKHAGEVFLGHYSAVAAGDFVVGPSHVLPTGGQARVRSGLSVLDFLKFVPYQKLTREGLARLSRIVQALAEMESLPWHAKSVKERIA